jgi:hypothetical protein
MLKPLKENEVWRCPLCSFTAKQARTVKLHLQNQHISSTLADISNYATDINIALDRNDTEQAKALASTIKRLALTLLGNKS